MKKVVITSLLIIIVIVAVYLSIQRFKYERSAFPICAIMITGKDDDRIAYAKKSVANFLEQTYENKILVIINHHPTQSVIVHTHPPQTQVFEFHVPKTLTTTLGQLRNIALQMVPVNACWTTWDDDDYRHPTYLETLASHMPIKQDALVAISRRLEYNKNNGVSWQTTNTEGYVLFLAPFDNRVEYLDKNTLEDVSIINDYSKLAYAVKVLDNDPSLYVRLVHTNNTSTYVDPHRTGLRKGAHYSERYTTTAEKSYIESILPKLLV